MKACFSFLFLILFGSVSSAQTPAQTVPDFTFFQRDNKPFTRKDLAEGKRLFFIFFDASCEHCQRAVAYISKHFDGFKNTSLYMITLDDAATTDRFLATYGTGLKEKKNAVLLRDKNNEFIAKFGPRKYPSMFLYSKEKGLLLYDDNDEALPKFLTLLK